MRNISKALNLLLCSAVLATAGCKKDNDHTDVTFVNHVNKVITLDIYNNRDNYYEGKARLMRKVLKYNDVLVLTKDELASGSTYYADWYDDTHYYNNWFNDASLPDKAFVAFTPTPGNNTYYLEPTLKGNASMVFLGDTTRTHWKAVDAYIGSSKLGYTSVWSSLTDNEKVQEVVVRKDFNAIYSYINTTGTPTTSTYSFKVHNSEDAYIEFLDSANASAGYMMSGTLPTSTQPEYASSSKDTILALLPTSDYYFIMVKE